MNEILKDRISGAIGAILATGIIAASGLLFSEVRNLGETKNKVEDNERNIGELNDKIGEIKVQTIPIGRKVELGETYKIHFSWDNPSEGPLKAAYIGNITELDTTGPGGFAELVLTLAGVDEQGGYLWIHNPVQESKEVNFKVKIIAVY